MNTVKLPHCLRAAARVLFAALCAIVFTAPRVHAAAGDLDPLDASIAGGSKAVEAIAVQPDGKTIIGGSFTSVLGVTRNYIARFNADGTLDTTFNPNADSDVLAVAVQPDGKIVIGGYFYSLKPNGTGTATERHYIARLNADG